MKLNGILRSLICEIASYDAIQDAVRNKKVVSIYYEGDDDGQFTGKGQRIIEPVCFGRSKTGKFVVRAWEREGASYRGSKGTRPMPGWRFFLVDKISSFNDTLEKFDTPRPGFNPNGDKSMNSIIIISKF